MEVKAGYKQTEVGVIPEDWKVKKLGELVSLRTGPFGSSVHKSDYINGGIPFINPIHIFNGELFPDPNITLSPETVARLSEFQLRTNDIILGRRGEMGRCAVVQDDQQGWLCGSGSMILRPNSKIVPEFLQRIMSSSYTIAKIEEASVGSTMINLNQAVLFGLSIPYPSLPEQQAIAEALSDADALIEALKQLIAKRRQVKQGAMQELLTGKRRLPGFGEEWKVKKLGDIAELKGGYSFKSSTYQGTGDFKIITISNVQDGFLDLQEYNKVSAIPKDIQSHQILSHGDILVSMTGNVGRVCRVNTDNCLLNQRVGKFIISHKFDKGFFFHLVTQRVFINSMMIKAKGGAQGNLSNKDITEFELPLPLKFEEQIAIAEILSDMDAEIAALEAKLAKARQVKQGMMQELLTGRVRLI